jgi:hypothetical protein
MDPLNALRGQKKDVTLLEVLGAGFGSSKIQCFNWMRNILQLLH